MNTNCTDCPFRGKQVPSKGDPSKCKYVLIGEAPGRDELFKGQPFIGETGRLLKAFFARAGADIYSNDFYLMNAMSCAVKVKTKANIAVGLCRDRVIEELEQVNPDALIVVMGNYARMSLYPGEGGGILLSRGWREWEGHSVYVMAHPSFYLYNPDEAPMLIKDVRRILRGRQPQIGPFNLVGLIPLNNSAEFALVDFIDYTYIRDLGNWRLTEGGYPRATFTRESFPMHQAVFERFSEKSEPNMQLDHKNCNKLDNRRCNLREVTFEQQMQNRPPKQRRRIHKEVYSRFKGVKLAYDVSRGETTRMKPWRAAINKTFLGHHSTEEEAARAYDKAAKERYGEYAYLNFPPKKELEFTAYVIDTLEKLSWLIKRLREVPITERGYIAYDLETDQIDFQRDRILCATFQLKEGEAWVIPDSLLYKDGKEFITTRWTPDMHERFVEDERYQTATYLKPDPETVKLLEELFDLEGYLWTGHNAKFDLRFLIGQLGVSNGRCDFDSLIAHYALDERKVGHGLKALADDYFDVGDYESELHQFVPKKNGRYSRIPRDVLYRYNSMDTECTLRLTKALEAELRAEGLFEFPFKGVLMKVYPMLLNAELIGMFIDWNEVDRIEVEELEPEIIRLRDRLRELCEDETLNPLSSQKINSVLFDKFKFPIISARTRAGGHHVTGRSSQKAIVDAWRKMRERGELKVSEDAWEFVEVHQQYKHLRKLLGSYVRKWRNHKGIDDRVHTTFQLWGTVTGRLAATDPPMQTIPSNVTDHWGPLVANYHQASPGKVLLYADYSQGELMIAAGLSKDKFMISTFQKDNADYHSEVARAAFGENFTRDDRHSSKKLTFGWLYGGNVKEIALDALQFDGPVADRFAKEWDNLFEGVVAWRKAQAESMLKKGYVQSIYGRKRRQLLLVRENVGKAQRIAVNAPIQSALSDFNLMSATLIYEYYKNDPEINVILLIHDSLIVEAPIDRVEEVKAIMEKIMVEVPTEFFPEIPFQAEVKVDTKLGELTK